MRTKFLLLHFSLKLEVSQKNLLFSIVYNSKQYVLLKIFELITDNFYQKIIKYICPI